jgi:hypothetical protein
MIMQGTSGLQGSSQALTQQSEQSSLQQQETDAQNKKDADALQGFSKVLQELPS